MQEPLPEGRYLFALWSIPANYGGLTSSVFDRARMFRAQSGVAVDILLFGWSEDLDSTREELVRGGALGDGVRLCSIYEHFRDADLDAVGDVRDVPRLAPDHDGADVDRDAEGRLTRVSHGAADSDYYRADGTRFLAERAAGSDGFAQITLFALDGGPARFFDAQRAFFQHWLDELSGETEVFLFVDSARKLLTAATLTYRRPRTTQIYVLHRSHLERPDDPRGPIASLQRMVLDNLSVPDAVIILTARQRNDIAERFGHRTNLFAIGHPAPDDVAEPPGVTREPLTIAVVARLHPEKRVDHAIRAMPAVLAHHPDARLEIYGEGEERPALEQLVDELGLGGHVTLFGHVPRAVERLEHVAVSVLTSTSEAWSLVVTESLAHGCPVVAYDVRYGPSDQIESGLNGHLVTPGDIQGLADGVVSVLDDRTGAMSVAARASARAFSEAETIRRWDRVLRTAAGQRAARTELTAAETRTLGHLVLGDDYEVHADVAAAGRGPRAALESIRIAWLVRDRASRDTRAFPARVESTPGQLRFRIRGRLPLQDLLAWSGGAVLDVYVSILWNNSYRETRVPWPDGQVAVVPAGPGRSLEPYRTVAGNVSLRVTGPAAPSGADASLCDLAASMRAATTDATRTLKASRRPQGPQVTPGWADGVTKRSHEGEAMSTTQIATDPLEWLLAPIALPDPRARFAVPLPGPGAAGPSHALTALYLRLFRLGAPVELALAVAGEPNDTHLQQVKDLLVGLGVDLDRMAAVVLYSAEELSGLPCRAAWDDDLSRTDSLAELGRLVDAMVTVAGELVVPEAAAPGRAAPLDPTRARTQVFEKYYESNYWGDAESVSGPGSNSVQTAELVDRLPGLFQRYGIRSLVDAPCGDLNWVRKLLPFVDSYIGADIVPALVERLTADFGSVDRSFVLADIVKDRLPQGDLILCRDALVHLPLADAVQALRTMAASGSTYLLATTFPGRFNKDITVGKWRPLDLTAAPFHLPPPLELIDEKLPGRYSDKHLALWRLDGIATVLADRAS
jgi:poly(glycerol-phosphate) alpha-glucosyltransferase